MFHGEARAEEFLVALAFEDAWRGKDPGAVAEFFAEDAELVSSAPFPGRGAYKGRARIRSFVTKYLAEELRMDLTRKQVARNGVAWTVRTVRGDEPANRAEGLVEAQFLEGKIKALRLGDGTRSG
jgi:NTE family protein